MAKSGGTSTSSTVGTPASRAMRNTAMTASSGSWEISVVTMAAERMQPAKWASTSAAVVSAVRARAM